MLDELASEKSNRKLPNFGTIQEDDDEEGNSDESDGGMKIQEMSDTFVLSIEALKNIDRMCS